MQIWIILRSIVLLLTAVLATCVLTFCLHIQTTRWPIQDFGFQPDYFNSTSLGSYDPASETINPVGIVVTKMLVYIGVSVGLLTDLISSSLLVCTLLGYAFCASTVFVELLLMFLLSTFWLATAIVDAMGASYPVTGSCSGQDLCLEIRIMRIFSFATWLFFAGYFMTLLTLAAIGVARGKKVFMANTITHDFYSRRRRSTLNTRSVVTERPHSQACSESVYSRDPASPIHVQLNMSSSMSRDAQLVADNWHELKSVPSIESPQPRMYAKHFSLGSDHGEITDIPLDDKEDFKAKNLV